ncbi:NUDIX domain-containing protein [Candidatus Woesearchaeota archaeon]|nr:NUDIX domain-containing protein [Candidatus Woesearchaeota archaeon]
MTRRDAALIVLYDDNNRMLLQHRDNNAPWLPNYWAFFGGGIEEGESAEDAVRRETLEELNYYLDSPKLVLEQSFKSQNHFGAKYVFVEKYDSSQRINLQEGQNFGWFLLSETKKLKIVEHDREVLEQIAGRF